MERPIVEMPYLALSKQFVLVIFVLSFTLTAICVWFSDLERHGSDPLQDSENKHG